MSYLEVKYIFEELQLLQILFLSTLPHLGHYLGQWVWRRFAIDNATLTRFFSFHFILPFIGLAITTIHLIYFHEPRSNNPTKLNSKVDKIPFHPYFTYKDIGGFIFILLTLIILALVSPYLPGYFDHFILQNPW